VTARSAGWFGSGDRLSFGHRRSDLAAQSRASRLLLLDLDGIAAIAGCARLAGGVPGFKRMAIEAVGQDLLTTFLARRI
jgi:hypothetical protein